MTARYVRILSIVLLAGLFADAQLHAQDPPPTPDGDAVAAPLEFDGAVLFHVRGVSSMPAATRARLIRERLVAVADDANLSVDAIHVVESEGISQIMAGDRPLLAILDADAALEQVQRNWLAAAHLVRLRQAVLDYRDARAPSALRRDAAVSAIATILLIVAIAVLGWLWRFIDRFFTQRLQARIHSVEFQSFEVMRAEQITRGLRKALVTIRTVVLLAIAFGYVGFLLAQWPWTRSAQADAASRVRCR